VVAGKIPPPGSLPGSLSRALPWIKKNIYLFKLWTMNHPAISAFHFIAKITDIIKFSLRIQNKASDRTTVDGYAN
jgi:hypothetical protein